MAKMGQEQVVPATREVLRRVSESLDVPVTVLAKETAHWNNVALNQLHDLLVRMAEELGA